MSEPPADAPPGAPSAAPGWAQRSVRLAAWIVLALAPLVARVAWEAHRELQDAALAQAAGDEDVEVLHLGRALRWRLPGASHDEIAIARLLAIGESAAAAGELGLALVAYREIRSALLGSRGLDVPHADVLSDVDARIAELMAAGDAEVARRRRAELLEATQHSRLWPGLAAATWLAWVWASARLLRRGLDARGRLIPGAGTRAGLLALALLVAWMLAWR
jgi:hypothetical protein